VAGLLPTRPRLPAAALAKGLTVREGAITYE
jgi:hypothetical protein